MRFWSRAYVQCCLAGIRFQIRSFEGFAEVFALLVFGAGISVIGECLGDDQ
jgi:hypothetical protein